MTELQLASSDGVPTITILPDTTRAVLAVDVFYTQHGKRVETRFDRENTMNRFWRHADAAASGNLWTATLPVRTLDKPLWVYANITYELNPPVSGAGYYYGIYKADTFNVSSLLVKASPQQLNEAGVKADAARSLVIETFDGGWDKEWFSTQPEAWPRATHKVYDDQWRVPDEAALALDVRVETPNELVIAIDNHAAVVKLDRAGQWQTITLTTKDFRNHAGAALQSWRGIKQLRLTDAERLRPSQGDRSKSRIVGKAWQGPAPQFRNLRWGYQRRREIT